MKPGDFIVTHGTDLFARVAQVATRSRWNHAALVLDANGSIAELTASGIGRNHVEAYPDHRLVCVELSDEDRREVVRYAEAMLERHAVYGVLDLLAIGLKIATRSRLVVHRDGTLICSEFVARALEHGGVIWDRDPSLITPADLYDGFVAPLDRLMADPEFHAGIARGEADLAAGRTMSLEDLERRLGW